MAKTDKTNKVIIPLINSINTDSIDEDIKIFGDTPEATPHVQNTGIERNGGLTNLYETEDTLTVGDNFVTQNGKIINIANDATTVTVDEAIAGKVSPFFVSSNIPINGNFNDVIAVGPQGGFNSGYMTLTFNSGVATMSLYDFTGVFRSTRSVTFTGLGTLVDTYTSINFVRFNGLLFNNSQEFILRIGDQAVILKESTPAQTIAQTLGTTTVLGTNNPVRAVLNWNGFLIVAGDNGRLGSFDGTNWKNYDGTGIGLGPFSSSVLGSSHIMALCLYQSGFVVAGNDGRLGSYDSANFKNYNGGGSGTGPFSNGTLIGTNNIYALATWSTYVLAGGVGGRIGAANGTTNYAYTQTDIDIPTSNSLVVGTNDVLTMAPYTSSGGTTAVIVGANGGRVGSWDAGGWIYYDGTKSPVGGGATWTLRSSALPGGNAGYIAYGDSTYVAVYSVASTTSAVMTSPTGLDGSWTLQTSPSTPLGWWGVAYGGGVFVALANGTSGTQSVMRSTNKGVTWTMVNSPVPSSTWANISFSNGVFLAVAAGTTTTTTVMRSTDLGQTWNMVTLPSSPAAAWQGCAGDGAGAWVIVAGTASTTAAIARSTDNGQTFTFVTNPAGIGWYRVAYGGGTFAVVGQTNSTSQSVITSPTGVTWTARTTPAITSAWQDIAYGNGGFVIVGSGLSQTNIVATSPTGATWTQRTCPSTSDGWQSVAYGEINTSYSRFVAIMRTPSATQGVMEGLGSSLLSVSNNSTAISTDNVTAMFAETSRIVIGGHLGKLASYNGTVWANYTAGSGFTNNATAVGAVQINSIVKFGTTYPIGAASGRLASFDGTNWKNYNGTGTGTGVFNNATIVGTVDINALGVLGSFLYIGFNNGVVVNMNSAGVFVAPYSLNGGGFVANQFTGISELNPVYAWRYESPNQRFYLILIPRNSLYLGYILDNTNNILFQLNAQYAVVQYSGSLRSRHLLTGKFTVAGTTGPNGVVYGNGQATSLVGWTDFVSFTTTPQYGTTPDTVGTVLQQNAIMGGMDVTYNNTTVPNNIQAQHYPNMIASTQADTLVTTTPNTNNLINGYGKLTNNIGEPLTVQAEIRVGVIAGVQSFLSAAVVGGGFDNLGTLITNVGEFDETYIPSVIYTTTRTTLVYRFNRAFIFIEIWNTPNATVTAPRIQKINDRLYKINTISPYNIVDSYDNNLNVGSSDYNGRIIFNGGAISTTVKQVAAVLYSKFSNGIDVGNILVTPTPTDRTVITIPGIAVTSNFAINNGIDIYRNNLYSFTTLFAGTEVVNPQVYNGAGVLVSSPLYTGSAATTLNPVATGGVYTSNNTYNNGQNTYFLFPGFEGYLFGNQIAGSYESFTINGQTYLFDGQNIYLADIDIATNILNRSVFLCQAIGLQLLAVSPTTAFFLSSFDNGLFTFMGGRSVDKFKRLVGLPAVTQGVFNTKDNTLLLDAVGSFIWARDNIWSMTTKKSNQLAGTFRLYNTTSGIIIGNNTNNWQYTYNPVVRGGLTVSTVFPLTFQSAYFGQDRNEKSILPNWIVTIYMNTVPSTVVPVNITIRGFDGTAAGFVAENKVINLVPTMFNLVKYVRFRVTSKHMKTLASSIQLTCSSRILIQEVIAEFVDDTTQTYADMATV